MSKDQQEVEPQDVAEVPQAEVDTERSDLDQVEKMLVEGGQPPELDPEMVMRAIVQRTLEARTPEEALAPDYVVHGKDSLDTPLRVLGVHWNASTMEEGPAVYAVMDAVILETGERVPVTIGGLRVMAQLVVLERQGAFPQDVVIRTTDRPTKAGFYPLRLEALETEERAEGEPQAG